MSMVNPFNPYYPAEAAFFANRRREQEWFRRGLLPSLRPESAGPWNAAILGPWGIGKSSLVRRLRELARETEVPPGVVVVGCTTGYGSLLGFTRSLIGSMKEEMLSLSDWSEAVRTELERWSVQIQLPGVALRRGQRQTPEEAANVAELLRSTLRRYWEQILEPAGKTLLFVLDDADLLQVMDPNALMILRAVFQDLHMYRARYGLVITGPSNLFGEVREVAEPVTRFFEHLPLREFDLGDTADAVRHPLQQVHAPIRVSDEAVGWVWEQSHGHPYFVAFIMRDVVDEAMKQKWDRIDVEHLQKCSPYVSAHLETEKFLAEWTYATPAERQILQALATGKHIGEGKSALMSRLVRKNLIYRIERGQYAIYHPLFAEFVRNQVE